MAAGDAPSPESRRALETLCEAYWYPLYTYVRRCGRSVEDAKDLTQGFFAILLEKNYIRAADQDRGRFRSFLITALRRYMSKERERGGAQKRGGHRAVLSLDFEHAEERYRVEPSHDWTPERIYERRWALELLDRVLARLRIEYESSGRVTQFERLKSFLVVQTGQVTYRELAAELETTEGAIKVAVHRLRHRYGDILHEEIAQTVADPAEIDDELDNLKEALSEGS